MKTMIYIDGELMDEDAIIHYTIANYPSYINKETDITSCKNLLDTFGHLVEEYALLPCVVGIDNCTSGGIAILSQHTGSIIATTAMPCKERNGKNEVDIAALQDWLKQKLNGRLNTATYYVEEPSGSKSLNAALSMASSFHSIRGFLETKGLVWHGVQARTWQKALMGKTKIAAKKTTEEALARKLWPDEQWVTLRPKGKKLHDGIVDSCLIAMWGRKQHEDIKTEPLYRTLKNGELVKVGDSYFSSISNTWKPITEFDCDYILHDFHGEHRRKIKP